MQHGISSDKVSLVIRVDDYLTRSRIALALCQEMSDRQLTGKPVVPSVKGLKIMGISVFISTLDQR
jgi:hypothetical protein